MDPLSIAASIGGLLTISVKLMSVGYSYGSAVKDFPQELQDLMVELQSLSTILTTLSIIYSPAPAGTARKPPVVADPFDGALEACERCLKSTFESLEKHNSGNRLRIFFKRITWPLDEDGTQDLFKRLDRYKNTFSLAISSYDTLLRRAMYDGIEELNNHQVMKTAKKESAEKSKMFWEIIRWLSSADPEVNHIAAREVREDGTGKWFTEGEAYRNWFSADSSFLWLHGKPGAGKTVLSSIIIDHVKREISTNAHPGGTPILIYFYCDFKDSSKQTVDCLVGSLIAQLVRGRSEVPEMLELLYRNQFNSGQKPLNATYLEECLTTIIQGLPKVFLIIDALDECLTEKRDRLCKRLKRLIGQGNISILVISRDEPDIREKFSKLPVILIKDQDVSVDIKIYVTGEISRQARLKKLKPSTKSSIISTLVNEANGMFRWASCCLAEIIKLRTDKSIKAALKSLPPTLEQSYERILCNIDERDKTLAIRVFQWLLFSQRPMDAREIVDAIAVEPGDTSMDPEAKLNDPDDILNICGGLVKLEQHNMTLGLAHFTVKEYLLSTNITRGPATAYQICPQIANAELTKTCLTYILFDDFTVYCKTDDELDTRLQEYPLLRYATCDWPKHIANYQTGSDETLDELVLSFFRLSPDCEKFLSWLQVHLRLARRTRYYNFFSGRLPKSEITTLLHIAAETGQIPAANELIKRGADINICPKGGPWCGTPLAVATKAGNLDMMRLLLDRGADPNAGSGTPYLALLCATRAGFTECTRLLISYGAEAPAGDDRYAEAIADGLWHRHTDVAELLLDTEDGKEMVTGTRVAPDLRNSSFTIFMLSVSGGFEGVFRRFWDTDWGVDMVVNHNLLPRIFQQVAARGHIRFIKIIMQDNRAKKVCMKDEIFCMVLREAAYEGNEAIVELLLSLRGDVPRSGMGVALSFAAANGRIRMIEYLIRAGADPCYRDAGGWSPLSYASEYDNTTAARTLSAIEGVTESFELAGMVGPTSWQTVHKRPGIEVSADGLEAKNAGTEPETTIEARNPIIPLNLQQNYSFEVEILEESKPTSYLAVGFADALFFRLSLWQPQRFEETVLFGEYKLFIPEDIGVSCGMAWGFCSSGLITHGEDSIPAGKYGARDTVGCHFNGTENLAFFTLNGKVVGKCIADIKGRLVPIVTLGPGAHIRANFGDGPLTYTTPDLSAEMVQDVWSPFRDPSLGFDQKSEPLLI